MKRILIILTTTLLLHSAKAQCIVQGRDKNVFHLCFHADTKDKAAKFTLKDSSGNLLLTRLTRVYPGYNNILFFTGSLAPGKQYQITINDIFHQSFLKQL